VSIGRARGSSDPRQAQRPLRIRARNDVIVGRVPDGRYEIKRVDDASAPSLEAAHALASIDDPHVSSAMEIAVARESRPSLIVIEHPKGETLDQRGILTPARAVHVAIQIAHALHAAHSAGVIHRNVRPKNVMLVRTAVDDAFVKLIGFGKVPKKTRDRFVPPEGNGKKVAGPHTDVYGLGACLDAMLAPARRDPELVRIIERATALDPKDRHASAGELEAALRAWPSGSSTGRRDPAWYALGALCAIGVGLIALNDHRAPPPLVLTEAHAESAPAPKAATTTVLPAIEEDHLQYGPPPLDSIYAPPTPPPSEPGGVPAAPHGVAKSLPTYEAPSGTFYVEEALRYVSATDGEAWRVATTKKVARCVETVGTGDCALNAMQLHCTLDRHGVLHCSRLGGWDKSGKECSAPQALEDCIGRAASGVIAHPKFDRADVQLAEMKYWLRRAR
jgi:hypothetical protein